MEGEKETGPDGPSPAAIIVSVASIGAVAGLIVLVGLAMIPLLDVGGFCAEGGPYVIEQRCPAGVTPVMAIGVPLMLILAFVYIVALPKTWKPLIILAWPALFVALAAGFLYGAFGATDTFQVVPLFLALVMLGLGIGPTLAGQTLGSGSRTYPDRPDGVPAQALAILIGLGAGAWLWFAVIT